MPLMGADAADDYVENPHFGDANLSESHLVAHRLFEINHHIVAISGFSVYQRHQRPSNRQIPTVPDERDWFSKNFGEVGNREAAEAAR